MREARGPEWTDWLHGARHPGADRHRHARARRCTCASAARCAAPSSPARETSTRRSQPSAAQPSMAGAALAGRVSTTRAVRRSQTRATSRVAVVDYGAKRSILRRLARGRRRRSTVFPHDVDADTLAALRRRAALERPRRPRAARRRGRDRARAARARAGARHLPRPPAARARDRPRAPTSCPFGHRGANHPVVERATGRVLVTSQNHGFAVEASADRASTHESLYDGTVEGARLSGAARALGAVPSRGRAGAARRLVDPRRAGSRRCALPRRDDIQSICLIGSGPIVIGQACEFDYAGCQALKVLRDDGYRTIVVNSNPATIMTDPGFADRTYLEPLDLEGVADVLRARAARRAAADDGRPDRAQPRTRAARGGRPRRARRRADRREGRRDRTAPRTASSSRRRSSRAACRSRRRASSPRPRSSTASPCRRWCAPRSRSAGTAAASSRRQTELERAGRARPAREPDRPGARRGVASAAGTSSSSRSSATAPTTS